LAIGGQFDMELVKSIYAAAVAEGRAVSTLKSRTVEDCRGDGMKRVAFVLKVREDKLQDYKMYHRAVWPEMLDALRRNGWRNYSLFVRKDGTLFGYMETPENLQTALADMAKEEVNARWQEFMAPYFESLQGGRPDEMMLELEEVFHLD
jgi:L-rhamnose mutarotase